MSAAPIGAITGPVSYFWQEELSGSGIFTDILLFGAGEAERAHGTYVHADRGSGRLAAAGAGRLQRRKWRAGRGVVRTHGGGGNVNDAPVGLPTISDLTPTEDILLTASAAGVSDADGLTTAIFQFEWQQLIGTTWTPISTGHELRAWPGPGQRPAPRRIDLHRRPRHARDLDLGADRSHRRPHSLAPLAATRSTAPCSTTGCRAWAATTISTAMAAATSSMAALATIRLTAATATTCSWAAPATIR